MMGWPSRSSDRGEEPYFGLTADDIDGWGLPFIADTWSRSIWAGNACYNRIAEPDAIRECIEDRAVVPISDAAKA
jgi:hypothetical protein